MSLSRHCAVYMLLLIALSLFTITPQLYSSKTETDCLYLLSLLKSVIDHAAKTDPMGEYMSMYLINISIPDDLRRLHVQTYTTIRNYYKLLYGVNETSYETTTFAYLAESLDQIKNYAHKLSACSHNVDGAAVLRVFIDLKLNQIEKIISDVIKSRYEHLLGFVLINPSKEEFSPGEEISLITPRDLPIESIELFTWPALIKLREGRPDTCVNNNCTLKTRMPTGEEVESLGLTDYLRNRVLSIAIVLKFVNGSYAITRLVKVSYSIPGVQISTPHVAKRGEQISITVISEGTYQGILFINNQKLLNLNIEPGFNNFTIETQREGLDTGLNTLKLCLNASLQTIPYCFDRSLIIEPYYPRVNIEVEDLYVSTLGFVTIVIRNNDDVSVNIEISNGLTRRFIEAPGGQVVQTQVFAGILPVQSSTINIRVKALGGSYDELSSTYNIVVVNISFIVLIILVSLILPTLISHYEKTFIFTMMISRKKATQVIKPPLTPTSNILKPYELGLGSRIALLYYELLRKLKIRLPYVNETLREHFINITQAVIIKPTSLFAKLLWKFLRIVERDLYSRRRPRLEEAMEVYEGVLSATSED